MKIALVGPELEENLALRYIHASCVQAGHDCRIYDFHEPGQIAPVAEALLEWRPEIVGLSMVFTARGREYVALAERLRELGYAGHITAGGHFASFHAREILRDVPAISSILHGEGEQAMVDLAEHLHQPEAVAGIVFRGGAGEVVETPTRAALEDLDQLPWPSRLDRFDSYLGYRIANVLSGRGCYGNCSFCSINAWHRRIGGPRLRQRSVEDLTAEMAHLYHDCGVRIFNFHDDNFFVADQRANLRRFAAIGEALDERGLGRIAIQIKARPDSINAETVHALKEIGLFRVFLGVESNAVAGLKALGRGIKRRQNHLALAMLKDAGLHVTFNLLMFEPGCSMSDLRDNIDYIEASAGVPLNFCRVEVYGGTPIQRRLVRQGRLLGDYWGHSYRIANPATQRAYEAFREVFTPRNFVLGGANLQGMAVDYSLHVLKHFFPRRNWTSPTNQCDKAIRRLNANNVQLLREICRAAEEGRGAAERLVAELSRRRERFDREIGRQFARLLGQIQRQARPTAEGQWARAASVAATAILVTVMGCKDKKDNTRIYEMAPASMPVATTVQPYGADETFLLAQHFQVTYGFRAGFSVSGDVEAITLTLELAADGAVSEARVTTEGISEAKATEVTDMAKQWTFPRPSRAGSLSVTFQTMAQTHMFEMVPEDWTHPTEMPPADPGGSHPTEMAPRSLDP